MKSKILDDDTVYKMYIIVSGDKDKFSEILKEIDPGDVPEDLQKIVEKNIIIEKNLELGKIKYDDKILHRSKVKKKIFQIKIIFIK